MSLRRTLGTMANQIVHDAKNKEFYAMLNGKKAFLSYQYVDKKTIDYVHTEVPTEFRGTGLALDLAKTAFDFALSNQLKMRLTCEYLQHKVTSLDEKYRQIVV